MTSPRWNVHPVGLNRMIMTNYEFYAREHHIGDLDIVLELVKEQSPDVYPYVLRYVHGKQCTFANIAVMRKDYFEQYASWLFPILFAAEQKIDTSSYDPHQKRVFGFLSERLCGAYIDYLQATQNARVTQLGVAFGAFAKPVTDGALVLNTIAEQVARAQELLIAERVHVTFAIDNNYAPHCGAAIASLIGAIHPRQPLTIHILHDDSLSEKNQLRLASLTRETAATVEFVDVDSRSLEIFPDNRAHISRATYFRLMLHKLLPETVEKTIYIDADVILADNICKIWLDLDDRFAAACADEGGVLQSRRLGLPITHSYFNAGVCVFNLKKLRGIDADALYLTAYLDNKALITLQDQDILNIAFRNSALELPLRWNANARLYRWNDLDYRYSEEEAQAAALKPGLIHFTDSSKPWHSHCQHPLAPLYWQWRQTTPWARRGVQNIRLFSVRAMIDRILSAGRRLEQDFRPYLKALKLRFQEKQRR
ncbi:lipopolysaccharide biosynthesis glycosyltransferase [Rhodoblastus sphagnicola]|nr:lipopolysaccharide biosynthesis glycosyltransferase [Rhodoblastus sphagnicola]